MYLWVIIVLACPAFINGYFHTISGVKYKVSLNPKYGTCVINALGHNAEEGQATFPWIANVTYRREYQKFGWDYLKVETNPIIADTVQAYSAGYCEAALTCESIHNHWTNLVKQYCVNQTDFCEEVNTYLEENLNWVESMVSNNTNDTYWHQVGLFYRQIEGLYYGHKTCGELSVSKKDFLWFNMLAEVDEMKDAFNKTGLSMGARGLGRCSAIVKLLPGNSDLLVAHNTWTGYAWMLRQVKTYSLAYHSNVDSKDLVPSITVSFSGYPGTISSIDDFYITDTGLVVLETTIGNTNRELWWNATDVHDKVSTMARAVVANRLSRSGSEWVDIFKVNNNGLYNNQWMVVDMKLFTPGTLPKDGALWILEQIPTFVCAEDKTDVLRNQGYWPSYNLASSPTVFNMSGTNEQVETFGDWFSYDKAPRAQIFKRDQNKVVDTSSLMQLMRYNDYKNDPFSKCNCTPPYSAENAIAARCDLNPDNGTYPFPALSHRSHGAIDVKITSYDLARKLQFLALCGPTNGTGLPMFDWSKSDFKDTVPHAGQPDVFSFPVYLANSVN